MSNSSLSLLTKDWGHPDKVAARNKMIEMYKKITGNDHVPINKEYWTMCGRNMTSDGKLINNCEFDQLTKLKFITPNQWHGVELRKEIADDNLKFQEGKWYHGTLVSKFLQYSKNVGFVNIDHHCGSKRSCHLIRHIFNKIPNNCFVTVNLTQRCGFYNSSMDEIVNNLLKETHPLIPYKTGVRYHGTNSRDTIMAMFYFYKNSIST